MWTCRMESLPHFLYTLRGWKDALCFASAVTCFRTLFCLSDGCPGSALSTTPDLWNRFPNKQLIGWVSCLAWWECLTISVCLQSCAWPSFSELCSLHCLWKNNVFCYSYTSNFRLWGPCSKIQVLQLILALAGIWFSWSVGEMYILDCSNVLIWELWWQIVTYILQVTSICTSVNGCSVNTWKEICCPCEQTHMWAS